MTRAYRAYRRWRWFVLLPGLAAAACAGADEASRASADVEEHTVAGPRVTAVRDLTLTGARTAIAGAVEEAERRGTTGTIAVADRAGFLVALHRIDGTFVAGDRVSWGKARTAALFRKPTRVFEEIIVGGRTPMLAIEDFTPMQGGVPLEVDGEVVGAIGVSGASSAQEDEELALAGVAAFRERIAAVRADPPEVADATGTPGPLVAGGQSLALAGARRALDGAQAAARARGTTGTIAVADATGHLVALERIDGTFIAGDAVSAGKARTAALFRKPTRVFEEIIVGGRTPMLAIEDFTPMQGGVPIEVDGRVVGAVGVSGAASAPEDEELALAGVRAVTGGVEGQEE